MKNLGRYGTNQDDLSIEQRRGTDNIDLNDRLILVQSPIEQVGQAFVQMGLVNIWKRDVYARKIKLTAKNSLLLFQFQKPRWTIIQSSYFFPCIIQLTDAYALLMSMWLHTKAIYYQVSDVCGYIGYHLYSDRESTETLYYEQKDFGEEGGKTYSLGENEYRLADGICYFRSKLRQIQADDIRKGYNFGYDFTDEFLKEQDAYAPSISWFRDFEIDQIVTVWVSGLERTDLERMDYMTLI
ncbi:hypothetical protein F7734_58960 [Scytonema sp. UIC 10036]|uniref:hypothetical protein n=1 Tax=Scytonema sp. UIC 10036 TaxID=2304196 RepID=UPI0012DA7801|nr:hypothetical protein [Scytonema sp. UIC 10036]MUH01622.1 hypothetical protein [Scytonema sp. UIC 10036]